MLKVWITSRALACRSRRAIMIVHDIEQAIAEIEQIGQNRAKLDFDMDGAGD